MGVLNFKLKTIYGNKKSNGSNEFFAPKKYEKFIEKCEQLYSINYRKDIHHALFYDKDKKEYPVSNNNDYEQLSKLILNKETIEVKLISIRAIKKDYDGYIASDEDIDTIIERQKTERLYKTKFLILNTSYRKLIDKIYKQSKVEGVSDTLLGDNNEEE